MPQKYACSACAFEVRSEDEAEVRELVQTHARRKHDVEMDDGEVRDGMQEVQIG